MPICSREPDMFPERLLQDRKTAGLWYVIQTKSRQEKAIARLLYDSAIAYYLPQCEKKVMWAGRVVRSYLPLFPGYVFLRGKASDRLFALRTDHALRVLPVADQLGLHGELEAIQSLLASGLPIVPHAYVSVGDRVRIMDGPFRDVEGVVVREKGALRLVVSVKFIAASVAVEVDREWVDRSTAGGFRRELRKAAS